MPVATTPGSAPSAATIRTFSISPAVTRMFLESRDQAHVHILSAFPRFNSSTPRATVGLLWALGAKTSTLTVQSIMKPSDPNLIGSLVRSRPLRLLSAGESARFQLDIACQKTPPSPVPEELRQQVKLSRAASQVQRPDLPHDHKSRGSYRSKKVTVPEAERKDWLLGRLERIGLSVASEDLGTGSLQQAAISPRRGRIPYIRARFEGTVVSAERFQAAQLDGVSSGKNYGLGMLLELS